MANIESNIIDTLAGYYGFTLDNSSDKSLIDNNGQVNRCFVVLTYPIQPNDVDINISSGENDWAIKTGDGSIIPCFDPVPLYINRDNTVIQFTMKEFYPANSPCSLVYHSSTASFSITQRTTSREFEENYATGHIGYTIEGYKGDVITVPDFQGKDGMEAGLVNKVMVSIPFPHQISTVKATISDNENHWAIRMGDNEIIPLKNPEIIAINTDNFVVLFKMHDGYSYPSNSPGILLYKSKDAYINITTIDDDTNFYPVSTLFDLPKKMISGQKIDLSVVKVEPYNASRKYIDWAVVSGPGEIIDKHYLYASKAGDIKVRATIENALEGDDSVNDFVQTFIVKASQNVITIDAEPITEINDYVDENAHEISVVAHSETEVLSYQWYQNSSEQTAGGTPISGATKPAYTIPQNIGKGDFYYYCKISSDGASDVYSTFTHLHVSIRCTSIKIVPSFSNIEWRTTKQLSIKQTPSTAELPKVEWFSSDTDIVEIDSDGLLTVNFAKKKLTNPSTGIIVDEDANTTIENQITIKAVTTNILGDTLEDSFIFTVGSFIPVTDIELDELLCNPGTMVGLSGTVIPDNATNKNITWSISNDNGTGCTIVSNVLNIPENVINTKHNERCMVRATIKNGGSEHTNYYKEFPVYITRKFTPVNNIIINNDINTQYAVKESIILDAYALPINSTCKDISWSLVSGSATLKDQKLSFNELGKVVVRATIKNATNDGTNDYTRDFTFDVALTQQVPVSSISLDFSHTKTDESGNKTSYTDRIFDPSEHYDTSAQSYEKVELPVTVYPTNASHKTVVATISKLYEQEKIVTLHKDSNGVVVGTDVEPADVNKWKEVTNYMISIEGNKLVINEDNYLSGKWYKATLHCVIKNGLSTEHDFITDIDFEIICPEKDVFVPLQDVEIVLPSTLRAFYPILMTRSIYKPSNASVINSETKTPDVVEYTISNVSADESYGIVGFNPNTFSLFLLVEPLSIFEWKWNDYYILPWGPGKYNINLGVENATVVDVNNYNKWNPTKTNFHKTFQIDVLPPYIPVKDITNVPATIPISGKYILNPYVDTQGGYDCYNPCWDEEEASFSDIKWSIASGSSNVISITEDGVITPKRTGSVVIRATIDSGVAEYLEWYNKTPQEKIDFTKDFTINVVAANSTNKFTVNILTLTLKNGATVNVTSMDQMSLLCNDKDADYSITIDNRTFQKSEIKSVKFWDSYTTNKLLAVANDSSYINSKATQIDKKIGTINFNVMHLTPENTNKIKYTIDYEWSIVGGNITGISYSKNTEQFFTLNIDSSNAITDRTVEVMCNVKMTKTEQPDIVQPDNPDEPAVIPDPIVTVTNTQYYAKFILINVPELTSLRDFGWNFTGLTSIDRIPNTITGDDCLRNFLRGCTSFNQSLTIPTGVTGNRCLMYFLRDCTSFNSSINIPNGMVGTHLLHGFLYGCTSFNKTLSIPSDITGESSMERFLYGCTSFNQSITIPAGLSGKACLRNFMTLCKSFNKLLTLPTDVGDIHSLDNDGEMEYNGRQLCLFMRDCRSMTSDIIVPAATGIHAEICEQTLSSFHEECDLISTGVEFTGAGATDLANKFYAKQYPSANPDTVPPYVHIKNLD